MSFQAGDFARSRELFAQALAIRSFHLGARHPSVGGLHNNLAVLERNAARIEGQAAHRRAIEHNIKALEIILEIHGPASTRVTMARRNLGLTLISAHRFAEAIEVFEEQRAQPLQHTPSAHAELLDARVRALGAYSKLGRGDEIRGPLAAELASFRVLHPEDSDVAARALETLARLAYTHGSLDKAEEGTRMSLAMHARLEDPPRILAAAQLKLADILWDKGSRKSAVAVANQAHEEAATDPKGGHRRADQPLDRGAPALGGRHRAEGAGGGRESVGPARSLP